MKEATFQKLAEEQFRDKTDVDQATLDAGIKELAALIEDDTEVKLDNGLYVTGKLDRDNGGVLVFMKIPAQRIRWQHSVACSVAPIPEPVDEAKSDKPAETQEQDSTEKPEDDTGGAAPASSGANAAPETQANTGGAPERKDETQQ